MGSKGVLSSAAAGVSLVAASLVLVIGVSALIGFRGFRSAREATAPQSVVLRSSGSERGAEPASAAARPVVIGARRAPARRRPARAAGRSRAAAARRDGVQAKVRPVPRRSGLSAPARTPRPQLHASVPAATPPAKPMPQRAPAAPAPAPLGDLVGGVADAVDAVEKPVEQVGDVLLDLRDVLP